MPHLIESSRTAKKVSEKLNRKKWLSGLGKPTKTLSNTKNI